MGADRALKEVITKRKYITNASYLWKTQGNQRRKMHPVTYNKRERALTIFRMPMEIQLKHQLINRAIHRHIEKT